MKKTAALDFTMWDIKTLTASDFTIEMIISDAMWAQFNENLHTHKEQIGKGSAAPDHTQHKGLPVVTFEAFLEAKLTEKLNKVPKIEKD